LNAFAFSLETIISSELNGFFSSTFILPLNDALADFTDEIVIKYCRLSLKNVEGLTDFSSSSKVL